MALSYPEIDALIRSGAAVQILDRFVRASVGLSIAIRTGQVEESEGDHETIVAGMALQRLMNTKDGRRLLGIKASNKVYNAKQYGPKSPHLDIARRLGCGEINREQALSELSDLLAKAQIFPDKKTIATLLQDLEDMALELRTDLEYMLRVAGWDGREQSLRDTFASIMRTKDSTK